MFVVHAFAALHRLFSKEKKKLEVKCENDECDGFVCKLVSKIDCYHYFHLFSNGVCSFCEKPDECIEFGAVSLKFSDIYDPKRLLFFGS